MKFWDKFGKNPWARVSGDKRNVDCTISFNEAKFVYKDNSVVIAGEFSIFKNIDKRFRRNDDHDPIPTCLCYVEIFGSDHQIREYNSATRKVEDTDCVASDQEKALFKYFNDPEIKKLYEGKSFKGSIQFVGDTIMSFVSSGSLSEIADKFLQVEEVIPSGKIPDYSDPAQNFKKSGWSKAPYSRVSAIERSLFLKVEMLKGLNETIDDKGNCNGKSIGMHSLLELTQRSAALFEDNDGSFDESSFNAYINLLRSCIN